MRHLLPILASAMLIAVGCGQAPPSAATLIQANAGYDALKRDCLAYLESTQLPDYEAWVMGNTNDLPAAIAALQPQIVEAGVWEDVPMVDIQVSGGFTHHGVIVFPTNTPAGPQPRKSSWSVTRIAEGVFEYRE